MNVEQMRALVRNEYRQRIDNGGIPATYLFVDEMTARIRDGEPDVDQLVRTLVLGTVNTEARAMRRGIRVAEIVLNPDGQREDLGHQQMVIPALEERGRAKIDGGEADIARGRADVAVAAECSRRARERGIDPATTLVGMVMSRDEEIDFRDELRRAA